MKFFAKALEQAREGRFFILTKIQNALSSPVLTYRPMRPNFYTMQIDKEKIRTVIESGRKGHTRIVEDTGVRLILMMTVLCAVPLRSGICPQSH